MCLFLIFQIIVNHAPNRSISGTRLGGDYLNGVLTVKNIVNAVSSADFNRVNLANIELINSLKNVAF